MVWLSGEECVSQRAFSGLDGDGAGDNVARGDSHSVQRFLPRHYGSDFVVGSVHDEGVLWFISQEDNDHFPSVCFLVSRETGRMSRGLHPPEDRIKAKRLHNKEDQPASSGEINKQISSKI
ncbi:unnamed protein product [Protopolystoma xenopodis]|uniref:Uncharacterized protein n=1 Tax=Protopolystoma xenopodis TaxID=117903 RepID=A0A448XGS9_9PLAT|nr:unnamed protein product [Protopolystoma xenopodis]